MMMGDSVQSAKSRGFDNVQSLAHFDSSIV